MRSDTVCNELEAIDFNKFVYTDGHTAKYHHYQLNVFDNSNDVYVFHAQVQPYSRNGLCLKLPQELSRAMDEDRRQYLCFIQLMSYGEEADGSCYVFRKYLRSGSGYDFIPIPTQLVAKMDRRIWTVAISLLDKSMLLQYDGYVHPDVTMVDDPLHVCNALCI